MFTIGCHLSTDGGYLAMAREAVSIGANTFQFFVRNPRGGRAAELDERDLAAYLDYAPTVGIHDIMGYASYTMNLVGPDEGKRDYALAEFAEDMARMEATPGNLYAMHCGSAEGGDVHEACDMLADAINRTLEPGQTTRVALVTMSGRGSEICANFDEMARVLDGVHEKDRVGVCLDTCALFNAGYDIVGDLPGVLGELDQKVGLQRVLAVHLNDAKYGMGSREGRHAAIGTGTIGFEALAAVACAPELRDRPFFLEEPHATLDEYEADIKRFKAARA